MSSGNGHTWPKPILLRLFHISAVHWKQIEMARFGHNFILLALFLFKLNQAEIANNQEELSPLLIGPPVVNCQIQRLTFQVQTKEPFHGRLFVKGHSNEQGCAADFYGSWSNETKTAKIEVDYHKCGMEKIRSLSPKGVTYANTITVQFHRVFITQSDKSYRIHCFYAEQQTTVASEFDVSVVPTKNIEHDMELPSCGYTIRGNTPNGPVVRSSFVGDLVYHRWECTVNMQVYGMLVHSCIIENEAGRETLMIDALGCPLDSSIVPALTYNDELNLAYTSTHVFKYPDENIVKFRCQIRICIKLDNGCQGLTPPSCETSRKIRRSLRLEDSATASLNFSNVTPKKGGDGEQIPLIDDTNENIVDQMGDPNVNLDVLAGSMFVFDQMESPAYGRDEENEERKEHQETEFQKNYLLPGFSSRMSQQQHRHRQHSSASFYDALQSLSPSPAPTAPASTSDTRRSAVRRGTDTTTAILDMDTITFRDAVHSSQWELCANRIILLSILMGFVLFFIGSICFVVYVITERSKADVMEDGMMVENGHSKHGTTPFQFAPQQPVTVPLPDISIFSSNEQK